MPTKLAVSRTLKSRVQKRSHTKLAILKIFTLYFPTKLMRHWNVWRPHQYQYSCDIKPQEFVPRKNITDSKWSRSYKWWTLEGLSLYMRSINSLALFKKKIQNISFYLTTTIVIYNDIYTYIHIFLFYYILNFIGNNYCKQRLWVTRI